MRDFREQRWSPAGSRPHIVIPAGPAVAELAGHYRAHAAAWWAEQDDARPLEAVLQPVDPGFLHLTLAWADRLTADLAPGQWPALHAALSHRLTGLGPVDLVVGPGLVGYYALEAYVAPHPGVAVLAAAARAALRDVLGPEMAREPGPRSPFVPHVAVLYGHARIDTDALASRILYTPPPGHDQLTRPVTMHVDRVLLADQDTWGPAGLGWDRSTSKTIRLTG